MSREVFKIDGLEFKNLPIIAYEPALSVVDGSGTDRTEAIGHPMFRDPAGAFWNLKLTLGGVVMLGHEPDLQGLVGILESYGREQYHSITMRVPANRIITQNMYCTSASFSMKKVDRWGETFWKPVALSFVAERAYIT